MLHADITCSCAQPAAHPSHPLSPQHPVSKPVTITAGAQPQQLVSPRVPPYRTSRHHHQRPEPSPLPLPPPPASSARPDPTHPHPCRGGSYSRYTITTTAQVQKGFRPALLHTSQPTPNCPISENSYTRVLLNKLHSLQPTPGINATRNKSHPHTLALSRPPKPPTEMSMW